MAYCPGCGAIDPGTGTFCMQCGRELRTAAVPAPAAEMPATVIVRAGVDWKQQVANYWHTLAIILIVVGLSFSGPSRHKSTTNAGSRPLLYTSGIVMEWLMVGIVWMGVRRRGYSLGDLIGRKWKDFFDVVIDILIAAGAWIAFFLVAGALAYAMGLMKRLPELRKALEFMSPKTPLELAMFLVLAVSAGICEEIVFRGYLQRQLAALSRSVAAGVVLSAIVFGAGHLYEGWERMIIIGVLGAILGTVSVLRKSLRPAIIAHTWQDAIAGIGQYVMRSLIA